MTTHTNMMRIGRLCTDKSIMKVIEEEDREEERRKRHREPVKEENRMETIVTKGGYD